MPPLPPCNTVSPDSSGTQFVLLSSKAVIKDYLKLLKKHAFPSNLQFSDNFGPEQESRLASVSGARLKRSTERFFRESPWSLA